MAPPPPPLGAKLVLNRENIRGRREALRQQPATKWIHVMSTDEHSRIPQVKIAVWFQVKRHLVCERKTRNMDMLKAELADWLVTPWESAHNLFTPHPTGHRRSERGL